MTSPLNQSFIRLQGCRQHNLKNLTLMIPKQAITAITGVSGSGKSSLAFDILFAEGQRRYLEYLSLQARTWIKQMPKPQVDLIEGLSPTLAISQGRQELYPLGTLATYTDIYDFLSLLYISIGEQHSPATGKRLTRYTRQEIIDLIIQEYPYGKRLQLLAPIKLQKETAEDAINRLQQMGFIRMRIDGKEWTSQDPVPDLKEVTHLEAIVDRIEMKEGIRERLAPSVELAMDLSQGILKVQEGREGSLRYFTEIYVCPETGLSFPPLEGADFNFNSVKGACPLCLGQGGQEKVNPAFLFSNTALPLVEQIRLLLDHLPKKTSLSIIPLFIAFWDSLTLVEETPFIALSHPLQDQVLYGSTQVFTLSLSISGEQRLVQLQWQGIIPLLNEALKTKKTKGSLSELPFIEWQTCPVCQGARLKPESLACLIQGKGIHQLCALTVTDFLTELASWHLEGKHLLIAKEILPHLTSRLRFLERVGLG
jgi:excinuclease ABC subunit A